MLSVPAQQKAKGEMEKGNDNDENNNNKCATGTVTGGSSWENGDVHSSVEVDTSSSPSPHLLFDFHPGQVASIIRRRAMIKQLAASYHAECLSYCRELLELQRRWEQGK
ncbi:hypothetical protein SUGI_0940140 [Cryptomeria japonica]|uniref:uncharacterized protein LOC131075970 isoform X2 n=1 Tax=Cryptomeria japonica TaxID=3369 RepID=UPI0024148E59|nr:uncharacterized protein LOC131075970 isoform X2 [Cryptomeria japonica]GLJ44710.1 hypothetical protein SUGI_0940140 [Cryptomeria japonica]